VDDTTTDFLGLAAGWIAGQVNKYPPGTGSAVAGLSPTVVVTERAVDAASVSGDQAALKSACQGWMGAWKEGLALWREHERKR
jgi:hypothetical protein